MSLLTNIPGNNVEQYIGKVKLFPTLSKAEELELARRFHEENNLQAARDLVLSHMRHVVYIAHGYAGYGLPQADLIQEGNIGLMKAVKHYKPEHNVRLMTFAVHWVKSEIQEFILKNWRIVKIATTKAQRKLFFNLRKNKTGLGWFSNAESKALADKLNVDTATVRQMEQRLSSKDVPFDAPEDSANGVDGQSFSPSNHLSTRATNPLQQLENIDDQKDRQQRIGQALAALDDRSRGIVEARWLADKKATLSDLAERYQISAERVRQLEKKAFAKLKITL